MRDGITPKQNLNRRLKYLFMPTYWRVDRLAHVFDMPMHNDKRKAIADLILLLRDEDKRITPRIRKSLKNLGYHGILALDIDGTISEPSAVIIKLWNEKNGTNFTINDLDYFERQGGTMHKTGLDAKTFLGLYDKAWLEHWDEIPALLDRELLEELQKYYVIHLVTNRPKYLRDVTEKWLKKNYPSLGTQHVIYANTPANKLELGYTHYVDDHHDIAHTHEDKGYKVELYTVMRPWTERAMRKPHPKTIIAVSNVNEAFKKLLAEAWETDEAKSRRKGRWRLKSV